MKKFGLIGYPLGHSMSPFIHNELFKLNNIDAEYKLIEIAPEKLLSSADMLKELDGFNVTIPHKTGIIQITQALSEKAELFKAVNTVKTEGIITGFNTDCHGFLRALDTADIALNGSVLICGAGGVARMFAFESALAGATVTLAVRQTGIDKALAIKAEIKQRLNTDIFVKALDDITDCYDLVINATPVGMSPNTNDSILTLNQVKSCGAVFDAIYNPLETKLLSYARQANIKYSNGLSMLVWQAAVAQEIWLGVSFENDDIKRIIIKTQEELMK